MTKPYELIYWPIIQGRGEFVRLVLEEAGADYVDVARVPEARADRMKVVIDALRDEQSSVPPFAPPILRAGPLTLAQVATICAFLGERHALVPEDDAGRWHTSQLQLTIADLVAEVHDTHHPVSVALTYEEQKPEAKLRAKAFLDARIDKYLGYFERVLSKNASGDDMHLVGSAVSYVDLSLFQVLEGLAYAFPKGYARTLADKPKLAALRGQIAERPRIRAYLDSERRIPFNEDGLFRRYPELDVDG